MSLSRREFMASGTAAVAAWTTGPKARARAARKYKACIIGDTKQGGYGHSVHLAFALRKDVAVVGLADPDEAGRAKYAAETRAERSYADYREMLEKERPDLVAVGPRCTVHHRDYLIACAEAGAHGFLEKPLCVDLAEADEMTAAIESRNLKWAMAFNVRAMPIIQNAKKMIHEEHLLGTILETHGRGKEDRRAGGEDLIVLGTHIMDLMIFLLDGTPHACSAEILCQGRPAAPSDVHEATEALGPIVGDCIHARYAFDGAVAGHFDSMKNPDGNGGRFGLDIYGSRGVAAIRFAPEVQVLWLDAPAWVPSGKASWKPLPGAPDAAPMESGPMRNQTIVDGLIAAIEEDRRPAVSLQDGRNALEMIQAVWESQIQGCRVAMPLAERAHPLTRWS